MRAVAVLAVVLFHADVPGVGGGYIGVDVFFVISGFLITGLLWREVGTAGTIRLRRFYGARARRLLPASATVGVVTAPIRLGGPLPPLQAQTVFGDGIASALYVGNYWFARQDVNYFAPGKVLPSPFLHYWSLGVEEQFYLVLARVSSHRYGVAYSACASAHQSPMPPPSQSPYLVVLALVAAVSFALSLAITYVVPVVAFLSLPTRAWQLAVGGLVALTAGHWRRLPATFAAITGWAGLAVILLACTLLGTTHTVSGDRRAGARAGHGASDRRRLCRTFSGVRAACWPCRRCGRSAGCSYPRYLWHWPVLLLTPPLLGHPLGLTGRGLQQYSPSPAGWRCSPCISSRTRCDSPLSYGAIVITCGSRSFTRPPPWSFRRRGVRRVCRSRIERRRGPVPPGGVR